jgi:hypothetical protein
MKGKITVYGWRFRSILGFDRLVWRHCFNIRLERLRKTTRNLGRMVNIRNGYIRKVTPYRYLSNLLRNIFFVDTKHNTECVSCWRTKQQPPVKLQFQFTNLGFRISDLLHINSTVLVYFCISFKKQAWFFVALIVVSIMKICGLLFSQRRGNAT